MNESGWRAVTLSRPQPPVSRTTVSHFMVWHTSHYTSISVVVARQIDKKLYATVRHSSHLSDIAYLFLKFVDGGEQNRMELIYTQQHDHNELHLSEVARLLPIEASPTELDTVNAILGRSLHMEDKLDLNSVTLVFHQAIYAKAK